jgi:hypothetical protein
MCKACTHTGHHDTETRGQTSMSESVFEPTILVSKQTNLLLIPRGFYDRLQVTMISFIYLFIYLSSYVSSGSIVSDYGLDDRAIGVRSPAGAEHFFLYPLCPDRLWGPPSLLYNGYRGSFPRG